MQFNSYLFLFLFLPATLTGYFFLYHIGGKKSAQWFLVFSSFLFLAWGNPWYAGLLGGSAVFNWGISRMISGMGRKEYRKYSKVLLFFGIVVNVGLLFYFKYFSFFIDSLNIILKKDMVSGAVLLPMGISFFTFQQIAWLVDSWRGETAGYQFTEYLVFTTYFPKIAMGPIILHEEFIPQLREKERCRPDTENLSKGLMMLAVGLFKKVVLAEFFAGPVAWGFADVSVLGSTDAFMVMLSYTLQIYFDFSGYCDMAAGISAMFNLTLPANFASPYKALSPVEFWKGWHMTLTRFLRKYVYFPLGGSRKGNIRTCVNIMCVFLISGLWHGANWTFVLWGILHGAAQVANRLLKRQWDALHPAFQWMGTFAFMNLALVVFRADSLSQAKLFFGRLGQYADMQMSPEFFSCFQMTELPSIFRNHQITTVMLIYFIGLYLVMNTKNLQETKLKPSFLRGMATAGMLVWSVLSLAGISEFVYFQF